MANPSRWRTLFSAAAAATAIALGLFAARDAGFPGRVRDAMPSVRRRPSASPEIAPDRARAGTPIEPDREYVRALKIAEVPPPGAVKTNKEGASPAAAASAPGERPLLSDSGPQAAPPASLSAPRRPARMSSPRPARDGGVQVPAPGDSPLSAPKGLLAAKADPDALSAQAASVAAAVRELKTRAEGNVEPQGAPALRAAIMRRIDADAKVEARLRGAIADVERSGATASPETLHQAYVDALRDNGLNADDEGEDAEGTAIARASSPPLPPIPPQKLEAAVNEVAVAAAAAPKNPPPEPDPAAEANKKEDEAQKRSEKDAPPPKGSREAFRQNRAVFDRAQKEFGVQPQDILAILYTETRFGRNTGANREIPALQALADNKRRSRARQGERDLATLPLMLARGELGGRTLDQLKGSPTGAIGAPQCQPSSCYAYGRSASGGPRNFFSLPDAILFVANYLHQNGYSRDVARSIWAYNHDEGYVKLNLGRSDAIARELPRPEQR